MGWRDGRYALVPAVCALQWYADDEGSVKDGAKGCGESPAGKTSQQCKAVDPSSFWAMAGGSSSVD